MTQRSVKEKGLYCRTNTDHFFPKYRPNTDQFFQYFPKITDHYYFLSILWSKLKHCVESEQGLQRLIHKICQCHPLKNRHQHTHISPTRVYILAETAHLFPSACVKYLISSLSNLNFGVIPPWLEKILNLAPLKCLEILQNRLHMWKLSD